MTLYDDYQFQRFSTSDGLSQSTVYSIVQDNKGFLWICTQQGLNRYDGYNFRVYKNNPLKDESLANSFAHTIYKDTSGALWIGSLDNLFSRYDETNDSFINFKIPTNDLNIKTYITGICEDQSGNLIIGTFGNGISFFDMEEKQFKEYKISDQINFNIKEVSSLFHFNNTLWIGTWNNGVICLNLENNNYTVFQNCDGKMSLSNNRIRFIFKDSRNIIWIGTSNGLNKYNSEHKNFTRYLFDEDHKSIVNTGTLTSIDEDFGGNLWIGTRNNGLIKFELNDEKFSFISTNPDDSSGLSSNSINSLYVDNSNVLWIGTFDDGLNKFDCETKEFKTLKSLTGSGKDIKLNVTAFVKDCHNNLWIGTNFDGLFMFDFLNKKIINMQSEYEFLKRQKNQSVLCLHYDENNILWVGTLFHGLNKFDFNNTKFENYRYSAKEDDNFIYTICEYNNACEDSLWLGTRNYGLLKFNKSENKFSSYKNLRNFDDKLLKNEIKCLLIDKSGILWIGTDNGGLNSIDINKGTVNHYSFEIDNINSLSDNYVTSIYESKDNNLWIGTMNRGLNKFVKKENEFRRFTIDDGLPDNTIRGILEDDSGNLWISTNNGLSKFNLRNESFRNYDVTDGLQSKEFNDGAYYKSSDGTMYFGGVNGFNFFKPDEIKDNPYIPNVIITDFQVFNQSVKNSPENPFLKKTITQTKKINLSYKESVFSFEFAALIYNNPQKNQYAYMMEGFDKDWIYCGTRRQATYTNLDPGEYIFRVKGSNNDGVWNEKGTAIEIFISPPFWKTWWFKSLGVLSIAGATGMAYRQKVAKVEKEKILQEKYSRGLLESQEKERKKIASGLHDTIAHDVLITKNKAVMGMKSAQDPDKVKGILNEISDLATSTLNDIRSISYDLHPHQIGSLGLTKAIKSIINNASKSTDIGFSSTIDNVDKILSNELEINIFRIIQECVNNIIKHSEASESDLVISLYENSLVVIISDNGKGFTMERKRGMGLTGITERVKLYNGDLNIQSEPGKGTRITITLPLKN